MTNQISKKCLLASSIAAVLFSGASTAQDGLVLEEITVTATKRESNIQDFAGSITAVSGDDLVALGVETISDLEKTSPGMKVRYVGSSPSVIMRGAGSAGTTDTAVPIYSDGLYQARSASALAGYLDVERAEVLKGPQGTLFGRNTLGGLVNLIPKKASTEAFTYGASVGMGDYDHRKVSGFVNLPLGEKLALRVTASDTSRDPYVENEFDSKGGLKDADESYLRAQLGFEISEDMSLDFTYSNWQDSSNGAGDFGHKVLGIQVNADTQQTDGINGFLQPRQGMLPGWGGGKSSTGTFGVDPSANITDDDRTVSYDYRPNRSLEEDSYKVLFNWDMGFANLKIHTGYSEFTGLSKVDGDYSIAGTYINPSSPTPINGGNVSGENWGGDTLQTDVTLTSTADGDLRWTAGFYNYKDESRYGWLWGYTNPSNAQTPTWAHWIHATEYEVKSQAVYGQAEYDISEDTMLTVGARRSTDERDTAKSYINNDALSSNVPTYGDKWGVSLRSGEDDSTDYRLSIQHNISQDLMVYASTATGFISGSATNAGELLDPTESESYEVGFKATLMDGAMTLNGTYYMVDYEGLTTSILTLVNNVFVSDQTSGGAQESSGVEMDMKWQASENLLLSAGLVMDMSEFGDFAKQNPYTENGGLPTEVAGGTEFFLLDGMDTPYSPDLTVSLSASYQIDMGDMGHVVPGVYLYYSDDYNTTSVPYFWAQQDAYMTVDLSATWYAPGDAISVQAYVRNASDELVITGSDTYSGARAVVDFNNPRTWGLRAAYNF